MLTHHAPDQLESVIAVGFGGGEAGDGGDGGLAGGNPGRRHAVEYAEAIEEGEILEGWVGDGIGAEVEEGVEVVVVEAGAVGDRRFDEGNRAAQVFVLGAEIEVQVELGFWGLILLLLLPWSSHLVSMRRQGLNFKPFPRKIGFL